MRIVMLKTQQGSPDGIKVFEYIVEQEYQVGTTLLSLALAELFLESGSARLLQEPIGPSEIKEELPRETILEDPAIEARKPRTRKNSGSND